jgi:molecular chaperone GrpE
MLDEAVATLDQWLGGQRLLYERLQMVLQSAGVRRIESEGQSFDPSRHRAVSTEARDDVPPGTIVGEEMRGYMLDGRILRYAEVIVAKNEQDSRH